MCKKMKTVFVDELDATEVELVELKKDRDLARKRHHCKAKARQKSKKVVNYLESRFNQLNHNHPSESKLGARLYAATKVAGKVQ